MNARARLFVTLEGYAVEGGFDRPGGPMTCYAPTIGLGRHVGPGVADDLWRQYENVLDFVPALGFAGVRLSVEWARVEPRLGQFDDEALRRYLDVVRFARTLGLDVTIALVDAVWPSWTGQEAWLLPWVVPHVLAHARRVVEALKDDVTGVVAFTQPEELVMRGFLAGKAPPWRKGAFADARFANAQIEGIIGVLGADEIVGPLLVRSSAVTSIDVAPEEFAESRRTLDVDEIYVRSLLRGSGPTSTGAGLLALHGDEWRVNAPEELLSALR